MDHAGRAGIQLDAVAGTPRNDAVMEKLRTPVAELVQDRVAQAEIQEDPALRERWADEGRVLVNPR